MNLKLEAIIIPVSDVDRAKKFYHNYRWRIGGVGHNLPQGAPQAFAKAVIDVDGF